jgi:hypothetical protein
MGYQRDVTNTTTTYAKNIAMFFGINGLRRRIEEKTAMNRQSQDLTNG